MEFRQMEGSQNNGGGERSNISQPSNADSQNSSSQNSIVPPTIELPKGGGAIRGIGEKFASNPVTGTGSLSVPIATSPGRSGFGPQLSLAYDSGNGNGLFGFGWDMASPAITRKTAKGLPQYKDAIESDVFILSGAEDLVPVPNADGSRFESDELDPDYVIHRYRPRIEGLFARIERWTKKDSGDVHWRSISKDNVLTVYGIDTNSRIVDPENPIRIFTWLICETRDDKGNGIVYEYKQEDGVGVNISHACERNRGATDDIRRSANRYLKAIHYGNKATLLNDTGQRPRFLSEEQRLNVGWMFEVVFDYGEHDENVPTPGDGGDWSFRGDPFSVYKAGFEIRTTRLCQRILMFHHFVDEEGIENNCLVRSTDLTYSHEQDPDSAKNAIYTFLNSVTQTGYKRDGVVYQKRSFPPVEFEYSESVVQNTVEDVDQDSLDNLPIGVDGTAYQWMDLHGEGIPGILSEQASAWYYKRNISPISNSLVKLAPLEQVALKPNMELATGSRILDLAGDGRPDLVAFDGSNAGFYEHDEHEGWQNFKPFVSRLNRSTQDPNLKFIDLDGDGHADILITEDDAFIWHASLAEVGFAPALRVAHMLDEESGPRIVFADRTDSIYLSDFSGDGLTDIVRIRNSEVCYWPNLGYGRFGAKITMDHSPRFDHPEQFSHKRIRLADIDGSGAVDIIYIHSNGVRLYFNQSGNSWSNPQNVAVFPKVDNVVNIATADLLGNGTACLVWSSPLLGDVQQPMKYVNLMGNQKPHLLNKMINNLGAETTIQYAPSTRFYLQDKRDGNPWITKLPFPVHVVEKVSTKDRFRQTNFSSSYSYHHGYYDGYEREFRGFGRVEQVDVEDYGAFEKGNVASPYITNDKTLYQPPIKTINWFHTGAFLQRDKILNQFENEYFPNNIAIDKRPLGFQEKNLHQPELTGSPLSTTEWREALRACKGLTLRQEVYELDVDALAQNNEHIPTKLYSAAFKGCHIDLLQNMGDNKHAVFFVTESEAITYHYELDLVAEPGLADPRTVHNLNLKIDPLGNILQSVNVVYPRRLVFEDDSLPVGTSDLITQVQQEFHLSYTENHFTTDVNTGFDDYRLRLPSEVYNYELTGINLLPGEDYFTAQQLRDYRLSDVHQSVGTPVAEIDYHLIANHAQPQKRIVQQARKQYFSDDLQTPLAQGQLNHLALPYETYTLAMTDDLIGAVLGSKFSAPLQDDLADPLLSGYQYVSDKNQYWIRSGVAGFSANAAEHFFQPIRFTDPFGNISSIEYDLADLYIVRTKDPKGNRVQVVSYDYRVLQPQEVEDINGNLTEVIFDVLGLPTATALKGKGDQADNLTDFTDEIISPDRETRTHFFVGLPVPPEAISEFQQQQQDEARRLLVNATARHLYYFGETEEILGDGSKIIRWGQHPASVCGIVREQHFAQLDVDEASPLQIAFEYSDGGGNVLVSKIQAEPENDGALRWIANGKTILNNKGKPVKQYEPYFTEAHVFEDPVEVGVTPIIYYDAAGRTIRTEFPDGSFSRVEFSQWHVSSYDANDTVLDPGNEWYAKRIDLAASVEEQRAAQLAQEHANTPSIVYLDSLGRDVVNVNHNRVEDSGSVLQDVKTITFSKLDTEGKPLWIRDARGNLVMQYITPFKLVTENNENMPAGSVPCYDIAGNLLFQHSMDSGSRWIINDAAGKAFYAWDQNERLDDAGDTVLDDRLFHTIYDELHRPLEHQLKINVSDWQVTEKFVYRDPATGSGTPDIGASNNNLGGQVFEHYDASGLMTNHEFDFKGNLLEVTRQLASVYQASVIDWSIGSSTNELEDDIFTQSTEYDAMSRMVQLENWHIDSRDPTIYTPQYNPRGILVSESLEVNGQTTEAVHHIEYDAKGLRQRIDTGNGSITRYQYDPQTFRLIQLRTTRSGFDPAFPDFKSALTNDKVLQQLFYTHDPVGNVTEIRDDAYEPVFFSNQLVEPRSSYRYDALYRLLEATGREHIANSAPQQRPTSAVKINFPVNDATAPNALRNYTQAYQYDSVGNITQMKHTAAGGNWTRHYDYANDNNRLLQTWLGSDESKAVPYDYDTHGNMLNLNRVTDEFRMRWDSRDMIHNINLGGGGEAWYNYDAGKQRTRKRIDRIGNEVEERLYLGGMELYRRWVGDNLVEEIETHHLFVDDQRVLLVEDVLKTNNPQLDVATLYKYQYSNHLSSVGLELNADAEIISYEEYHPYGTTAYSANNAAVKSTRKRYRYTGMERDEESGLSYHSARYYLPWLGRWGSSDPTGINDGVNDYAYVQGNPIVKLDIDGEQTAYTRYLDRQFATPEGVRQVHEGNRALGETLLQALAQPEVVGTLQVVGSLFEFVGAGALLLTPEPTMATKVGGIALGAHGVDTFQAGVRTLASGEITHTVTHDVGEGAALGLGASPEAAQWAGVGADVIMSVGPAVLGTLGRTGPVVAAETLAQSSDDLARAAGETLPQSIDDVARATGETLTQSVDDAGSTLFRGTSEGYPGSAGVQRVGVTPTSTDPLVSTVFATESQSYGQGVVQIATPANLEGVAVGQANVLASVEREVVLEILPLQFAERAGVQITAAQARSILSRMGHALPAQIHGPAGVTRALATTARLTPEEITIFIEEAALMAGVP